MSTEKQIIANRRNAQLSTGPKTEDGKKHSSLNAYRHGLTGQIEVLTAEEKEIYDQFCAGIVGSLNPADPLESQLAQSIAEGHWRLNRARAIENNIFTLACSYQQVDRSAVDENAADENAADEPAENPAVDKALAAARVFVSDPERFQLLTVYEMRIHRKTQNDLRQLKEIQAARRAEESKQKAEEESHRAQAFEEAQLIIQLDESEGIAVDPAAPFHHPIGFVFSTAEIVARNRFETRLQAARHAAKHRPEVRRAA